MSRFSLEITFSLERIHNEHAGNEIRTRTARRIETRRDETRRDGCVREEKRTAVSFLSEDRPQLSDVNYLTSLSQLKPNLFSRECVTISQYNIPVLKVGVNQRVMESS